MFTKKVMDGIKPYCPFFSILVVALSSVVLLSFPSFSSDQKEENFADRPGNKKITASLDNLNFRTRCDSLSKRSRSGVFIQKDTFGHIDSPLGKKLIDEYDQALEKLKTWLKEKNVDIPQGNLLALTELIVCKNQLTVLPEAIYRLINLIRLSVIDNQLTALPERIDELTNLIELNVSWNRFTSLPTFMPMNLTDLDVSHNQLTALPIALLTNLTYLDFSYNNFTIFPEKIDTLTNLTYLNFSMNQFTTLPEAIGELTKLTSLSMYMNQLTALPERIDELTKLTELDVSWNLFRSLPTFMPMNLTKLDVSHNHLIALPDKIFKLQELKIFAVDQGVSQMMLLGNIFNLSLLKVSQSVYSGHDTIEAYLSQFQGQMAKNAEMLYPIMTPEN